MKDETNEQSADKIKLAVIKFKTFFSNRLSRIYCAKLHLIVRLP